MGVKYEDAPSHDDRWRLSNVGEEWWGKGHRRDVRQSEWRHRKQMSHSAKGRSFSGPKNFHLF